MKEFFVGLMVLVLVGLLAIAGTLFLPLLLLLGLFLRFFVGIFMTLFVIWLVGKLTLLSIEYLRKKEMRPE